MKSQRGFAITALVLIVIVFSEDGRADLCGVNDGIDIFFVNGVWNNTWKVADDSRAKLDAVIRPSLSPIESTNSVTRTSYNPANLYLGDLIQQAEQAIGNDYAQFWRWVASPDTAPQWFRDLSNQLAADAATTANISDPGVLGGFVRDYRTSIGKGRKVVLVAHSQGNYFANSAVRVLTPDEQAAISIVAVATPDSDIARHFFDHTTYYLDPVILLASAERVAHLLPPSLAANTPGSGHEFVKAYLAPGSEGLGRITTYTVGTIRNVGRLSPYAQEFLDLFDRADGTPLGNGWVDSPSNQGGGFVIQNGTAAAIGLDGQAGVYRAVPVSAPFTVHADITGSSPQGRLQDFQILYPQLHWTFGLFGNGQIDDGLQLTIDSDGTYPNVKSVVRLKLHGVTIAENVMPAESGLTPFPISFNVDPTAGSLTGNWPGGGPFGGTFDVTKLVGVTNNFTLGTRLASSAGAPLFIPSADNVKLSYDCSATAAGPSAPTLLTPINGAAIPQNNPNIGCSFMPFRGYGLQIPFDWTDSVSSDGIAGYDIFAARVGATLPIVQTFVNASNYTKTSCNTFVIDQNLDNWQWSVRAKSGTGVYGPWSDTGVFSFQPCRLSDGTACSASSSFFDDFNRADGPVGNGWSDTAGNINGRLVIRNNAVAASNMDGFAGIFRPMDVSKSLTVTATITPGYGCCPSPDRFDAYFVVGNNRTTHNGYGISVSRSDAAYNNSSVSLVLNGAFLATTASPFQFTGSLTVTATINPDGTVAGSVVGAGGLFSFSFGTRRVTLSGSNFEFETGFTDSRGSTSPTYPTMDNIGISQ